MAVSGGRGHRPSVGRRPAAVWRVAVAVSVAADTTFLRASIGRLAHYGWWGYDGGRTRGSGEKRGVESSCVNALGRRAAAAIGRL